MSRPTHPKVEASSSRVRPRSPEPFDRNVRQKTVPPVPSAGRAERDAVMNQAANHAIVQEELVTAIKQEQDVFGDHVWRMDHNFDTALTHLLIDNADHPMYQRHLDHILREMCKHCFDAPIISKPLIALRCVAAHPAPASGEKRQAVKRLLTEGWLGRILQHIGEVMEASGQDGVVVHNDMGNHRIELKVLPIVPVDDTEPVAGEDNQIVRVTEQRPAEVAEEESADQYEDANEDQDQGESDDEDEDEDGSDDQDNSESDEEDNEQDGSGGDDDSEYDADMEDSGVDCSGNLTGGASTATHSDNRPTLPPEESLIKKTNPVITLSRALDNKARGEGVDIERYKDVRHPARAILLKEDMSGDLGDDVDAALTIPIDCALRWKLLEANAFERDFELEKYCRGTWLVRLASERVAHLLAGKTIIVQGRRCQMEAFRQHQSQVYVCSNISKRPKCNRLLKKLADVVSHFSKQQPHKVYVMKSRPNGKARKQETCVYVMLDRPSDVASFTFADKIAMHFVPWLCETKCQFCGDAHSLLSCEKFAPLYLQEEKNSFKTTPPTLTKTRPRSVLETEGLPGS